MVPRRYIGIDPGASGGVAVLQCGESTSAETWKMPDTIEEIADLLRYSVRGADVRIVMEKVWAMPRMEKGGRSFGMGATSAFNFGMNRGILEGCLCTLGVDYTLVVPQTWQLVVGLPKFSDRKDRKNAAKLYAERMLERHDANKLKVTHANADALLLAEYARLTSAFTGTNNGKARSTETGKARGVIAEQKEEAREEGRKTATTHRHEGDAEGPRTRRGV